MLCTTLSLGYLIAFFNKNEPKLLEIVAKLQ